MQLFAFTAGQMDKQLTELLDELQCHGVSHNVGKPDRRDPLPNPEPDTAAELLLVVRNPH